MRTLVLFLSLFAPLILVTACAGGKAPQKTQYLLPLDVPMGVAPFEAPVKVGLSRLDISDYLSSNAGVVVEVEPGMVRHARNHKWAEPLTMGLNRALRAQISSALGFDISGDTTIRSQWDLLVDIRIDRLHGNLDGEAILIAHWRVTPANAHEEAVTYRFSKTGLLQREGYDGLIEAEVALLTELSAAIADSVREFLPPVEEVEE
jgi:uncharacterized lipoprotein YmbA